MWLWDGKSREGQHTYRPCAHAQNVICENTRRNLSHYAVVELGSVCACPCRVCEQFRRADTRDALVDSLIEFFSSLTSLEKEMADRYCTLK